MDSSPSGWSGLGMWIAEKPLSAWTCCHRSQDISLKQHAGVLRTQQLPRPLEEQEIFPAQSPMKSSVALTLGGNG